MLDFCIYLLYRAGTAIASALPLPFLFGFGELMGRITWWLVPKYRRLALRNLEIAFAGEKSAPEQRRIGQRHFQRAAANLLCSIKMSSMPTEKMEQYLETENFETVHRLLRGGTPVILLLSHIGNWELFAQ